MNQWDNPNDFIGKKEDRRRRLRGQAPPWDPTDSPSAMATEMWDGDPRRGPNDHVASGLRRRLDDEPTPF